METQSNDRRLLRAGVMTLIAVAAVALTACNTVSGAGKDLQEGSDAVKDAITD